MTSTNRNVAVLARREAAVGLCTVLGGYQRYLRYQRYQKVRPVFLHRGRQLLPARYSQISDLAAVHRTASQLVRVRLYANKQRALFNFLSRARRATARAMNHYQDKTEVGGPGMPHPASAPVTVNTATKDVRLGFIRKVYTLLTINFAITIAVACAFTFIDVIREYVTQNSWVVWAALGIAIASLLVLACVPLKFPFDFVFMYVFVLCFSTFIGVIVARYYEADAGVIVLQAFIATVAVFLTVTAFVFITKIDFSFLYYFLAAATVVLIVLSLLTFLISWPRGRFSRGVVFAISVFGALLMTGYLLFDTSLVMKRLGPDQWLMAVISLYVDVTNLFLYLLNIFSFIN